MVLSVLASSRREATSASNKEDFASAIFFSSSISARRFFFSASRLLIFSIVFCKLLIPITHNKLLLQQLRLLQNHNFTEEKDEKFTMKNSNKNKSKLFFRSRKILRHQNNVVFI